MIRILSVDDHALFRGGIGALLAGQSDMSLIGEASDGREAIQQFRALQPDVTLMDLQMPEMNGVDAPETSVSLDAPDKKPPKGFCPVTTFTGGGVRA